MAYPEYTIQNAINGAIQTAEEKKSSGQLYFTGQDDSDHDWSQGDPETVHSIISLYQDDDNDDGTWETQIRDALFEEYSEYF